MVRSKPIKAVKRRPSRRKRGTARAYDAAIKNEVLQKFEQGRIDGLSNSEIFSGLGASPATVYRWLHTSGNIRPQIKSSKDRRLAKAIATLCDEGVGRDWDYLEAILTFAVWLHWPSRSDYGPIGTASLFTLYASKKENITFVADMPEAAIRVLARNLRLRDITSLCSSVDFDLPSFMWGDEEGIVTRDALAEGCAILLALIEQRQQRMTPSVNKLVYLWRSGATKYKMPGSRDTLLRLWATDGSAAPFFYAEKYQSRLDWGLDPESQLFLPKVERLMSSREQIKEYFQIAKGATVALSESLHKNAIRGLDYPRFPIKLVPARPPTPPLSDAIKSALKGYNSALSYC